MRFENLVQLGKISIKDHKKSVMLHFGTVYKDFKIRKEHGKLFKKI